MTGSSLAPAIIAIVVSIALAAWLVMVFHAARHPFWKHQSADSRPPAVTGQGPQGLEPAGTQRPQTSHAAKPEIPHAA